MALENVTIFDNCNFSMRVAIFILLKKQTNKQTFGGKPVNDTEQNINLQ